MTSKPEHRSADTSYRGLLNRPHPAGRYRLLDRNSDPDRSLPAIPDEAPVDRPCDPHCQRGS
ncbi:hypothetical protein U2F26_16865 [Micromonospora sp. 4G57]|uniref:Uncharacterized protein n=1 Tax=Micromonospora sicca TaxID=2202420 RepID=A0ABU5JB48_9ACTN|nr:MULTISPECIES: hypothetical protein [unclassified Micromonospora]MDZ5444393.1 hypothetical protein [Micromonospora sp. 4G57]MDZ5489773.1 hypothetical protein [Micromonospora sp. 4G53]